MPGNHPYEDGFAAAGRAEQGKAFALLYAKVETFMHLMLAIGFINTLHLNDFFHKATSCKLY